MHASLYAEATHIEEFNDGDAVSRVSILGRKTRARGNLLSSLAATAAAFFIFSLPALADAMSDKLSEKTSFDLPAQPLGTSLKQLANQSGIQILFEEKAVEGIDSPALKVRASAAQALDVLLSHTDLEYTVNDQTVAVRRKSLAATISLNSYSPSAERIAATQTDVRRQDSTRLVQADSSKSQAGLEEVIVTAQKREERLQDVPVPVTAIGAAGLSDRNQVHLQDYYSAVPGLNLTPAEAGGADITIRGITTGGGGTANPTVSFVVDDVPFGASSALAGSRGFPDIDPSDLERIEVLRGPQGTLYGASSLGGLLKLVTVDPSTDGFSARVQADVNSVTNGDGPGYGGRVAVNVPIGDTFAIRASGFGRRDAGYIDNVQGNERGVNWGSASGGRVSGLWRPTDTFSLKLSALVQTADVHGYSQVALGTGLGDLEQNQLPRTGANHTAIQAYSAVAKATFGAVDVTFLSGYNSSSFTQSVDSTPFMSVLTEEFFPPFTGTPFVFINKTKKYTEELRLEMPLGEKVDWLMGGFYTHESSDNPLRVDVTDDAGYVVDSWGGQQSTPSTYEELAAFTNVTVRFTDRFDTQFGARQSRITQQYHEIDTGAFALVFSGSDPYIYEPVHTTANALTYLVTPRFRVSPEWMIYGRFASGYRPGGPNPNSTVVGVSDHFDPDKTRNYEVGVKGTAIDGALSFDASVYYIDWKNVQLQVTAPTNNAFFYTVNLASAKSKGVELAVESRPVEGLVLSGWVAWNDAELAQDLPRDRGVYGLSGDRLPNTSRISGNLSLRRDFPLGVATAFAGVSASYVGDRQGLLIDSRHGDGATARQDYPAYIKTDLDVGAKYAGWTFTLYGNNVTDRRGQLSGGVGIQNPVNFGLILPRTIGLSVAKTL